MIAKSMFGHLVDGQRFSFLGETFIKVLEESDKYNAVNENNSSDCVKFGKTELVEKV
ncbi:gp09 [Erwinia phage vB_EamM-Y2]|uniref:Gp09 n=1 Tax=Erwinia phage vB_EamM-Y2 TaxID=1051676 RepID=G0YPV8_9CAUD|nr:gp09 [Erwinia phage vB_EamM-Y2]AEJ81385.1 gp09 [Erwinia phage vB_EamM-Y2]